jgi:hypothetical protein
MLPNLSQLDIGVRGAEEARIELQVTESSAFQFRYSCAQHTTVFHVATVSLAETFVAEYCYHILLSVLPGEEDRKRRKVGTGEEDHKRRRVETGEGEGSSSDDDGPRDPRLILKSLMDLLLTIGTQMQQCRRRTPLPSDKKTGVSSDEETAVHERAFVAWQGVLEFATAARSARFTHASEEFVATCRKYLSAYLALRGLPDESHYRVGWIRFEHRVNLYDEYFSGSNAYYENDAFRKTLRVHAIGADQAACVGIVMLDDLPRVYRWSAFYDPSACEEPQWRMQGIVACPFFLHHNGGGVGSAVLRHVERRLREAEGVSKVAVSVLRNASSEWKAKLHNATFVNCSGCYRESKRAVR